MKEFEVSSKEITKVDGTKFLAYRGYTKKGWLDLRFTKKCQDSLSEELKQKLALRNFKLTVDENDVNISKKGKFDIIYVNGVSKVEEITFDKKLEDYFD